MVARSSVENDKKRFMEKLHELGGYQGNQSLKHNLNWSEDRYWRIHGELADDGVIIRGRGRGGSVSITDISEPVVEAEAVSEVAEEVVIELSKEADLYEPAKYVIENSWVKERSFDDYLVEITASVGRRNTGGTWTRPDVSVLATKAYPFLPDKVFEIVTFEIKNYNSIDVLGVFEALSHAQFATLSYVIFCTQGQDFDDDFADTRRVISLANQYGVGLIVAENIHDHGSWDERVRPRRNTPDPEQANLFISTCFSKDASEKVIKWHK